MLPPTPNKWNRGLGKLERGEANGLVQGLVRVVGPIQEVLEFVPTWTERESPYRLVGRELKLGAWRAGASEDHFRETRPRNSWGRKD